MSDSCPTVKIKSGDSYAIINESDFDAEVHQVYKEPKKKAEPEPQQEPAE